MPYTTDDAVTVIRRRAYLPPAGGMADAEIVDLMNQERRSTVSDLMRRAAPSFWRVYVDFTIAANTDTYRIPTRAMMQGFDQAVLRDPTGYEQPIVQIDQHDRHRYVNGGRDVLWPTKFAFALDSEHVRLFPAPTAAEVGYTLRVYYHRSMSDMVLVARAMAISAWKDATAVNISAVGTEAVGAGLQTANSYVDIVRGDGMFGPIYTDLRVVAYAAPALSLSGATLLSADIATYYPGGRKDYVCLAGETVYPEFPADVWPVLISAAAVQCLKSQKDFQHAAAEQVELDRRVIAAQSLAEPRAEEDEPVINRYGTLRRAWGR